MRITTLRGTIIVRGNSRIRRKYGRATWRLLAGALAVALFGSGLVVGGEAAPAQAGPNSVLQIVKKVDGQDAKRGLSPGDSVVYRVDFEVSDEDVEAPVTVTDVLPAEFAGWEISSVSAQVGGNSTGVTIASQPTSPIGSRRQIARSWWMCKSRCSTVGLACALAARAGWSTRSRCRAT